MRTVLVIGTDALHDLHDKVDGHSRRVLQDAGEVDVKLRWADKPTANQSLHSLKVVLGLLAPCQDQASENSQSQCERTYY